MNYDDLQYDVALLTYDKETLNSRASLDTSLQQYFAACLFADGPLVKASADSCARSSHTSMVYHDCAANFCPSSQLGKYHPQRSSCSKKMPRKWGWEMRMVTRWHESILDFPWNRDLLTWHDFAISSPSTGKFLSQHVPTFPSNQARSLLAPWHHTASSAVTWIVKPPVSIACWLKETPRSSRLSTVQGDRWSSRIIKDLNASRKHFVWQRSVSPLKSLLPSQAHAARLADHTAVDVAGVGTSRPRKLTTTENTLPPKSTASSCVILIFPIPILGYTVVYPISGANVKHQHKHCR